MTGMSTRRKKQRLAAISYGPTEPPVNIEMPEITGMFVEGLTVTCTPGVWKGADTIAFQWLADGAELDGETGSTLDLTVDYIGQQIDCRVTATNALGSTSVVAVGEEVWAATPARLFADGQDGVWLDPSDHSTLWIDEERTQNATQPGDVVWWIDDKSGNENHFSVDASANRSRLVRWPASAVREGYPRNSVIGSEGPAAVWGGSNSTPVDQPGFAGFETSLTGTQDVRSASRIGPLDINLRESGPATIEFYVLIPAGWGQGGRFIRILNGGNNFGWGVNTSTLQINPSTVAATSTGELQDLGDGIYRASITQPGFVAGATTFQIYVGHQNGPPLSITGLQITTTPGAYQRVGAGIWDVTEAGQPDCWGILANGVNTRYTSERGIPEYEDGKLRMLAGQTRFNPGASNNVIMTNQDSASTAGGVRVLSNANMNYAAGTYATSYSGVSDGPYPENDTKILDVQAELSASARSITLRANDNDPVSASDAGYAPGFNNNNWGVFAFNGGGNPFNGIIWPTILTAYAPDETLWDLVARDWLNSTNMLGVLDDD